MRLDLAACSDGELAALARAGRQTAYGELMNRHRDAVYRLARGHTGDADAALDITQQSFVAAFLALDRLDAARPFRFWISRIAINKCRDWARRRAVRRILSFSLPIDEAHNVADQAPSPETLASDRQELERTMSALAALPASLKDALLLRAVEGMSQSETALVLGISEKAVETRVYRARAKLEGMLRV